MFQTCWNWLNFNKAFSRIPMAATRFFRMSRPLGHLGTQPANSFYSSCNFSSMSYSFVETRCSINGGFGGKMMIRKGGEVKAASAFTSTETKNDKGVDLGLLLATVKDVLLRKLNEVITRKRKLYVQTFIEKGIMDCRFFTLLAVAGSLLGSLLCYVEGCFLILESYLKYFHALSQGSEQGHVVHLLIEAIDMFLVATAILVFGMGLHAMFVGSYNLQEKDPSSSKHHHLKTLLSRVGMNSVMQAKTKIGHAVVMILQVGVLEKFNSIPLVTGFDLACFAGAVFASSASIFLLSKLSVATGKAHFFA